MKKKTESSMKLTGIKKSDQCASNCDVLVLEGTEEADKS